MTRVADSDLVLKYKHAKHVGNHGDVLKHCILVQLINESLSDGPINVIDTHAGIGGYTVPIDGDCKDGIMRLLRLKRQSQTSQSEELRGIGCKALREYLATVMAANEHLNEDMEDEGILGYPGSPFLFRFMQNEIGGGTRTIINHYLVELNRSQFSLLKRAMDSFEDHDDSTHVVLECADGFLRAPVILKNLASDGSNAKSIVLIDPPYKDLAWECKQVSTTVQKLLAIDSRCTIMVWIPILGGSKENNELQALLSGLKEVAKNFHSRRWCAITLEVSRNGLRGSSVWIVNPPASLHDSIEPALSWLSKYLKQDVSSTRWETCASTAE